MNIQFKPVGLSVVRLRRIQGHTLHVEDLDILDRTPVLDIKPYVPELDKLRGVRTGWLDKKVKTVRRKRADKRSA
jgi:tRNA (adenine37-N6)-methyltransferase